MNRRTRRAGLVALAATTALLAGCAAELPTPTAQEAVVAPVLSLDQEKRILESVRATLEAAQANNDLESLKTRLTGPALELRWRQLEVAQRRGNADLVTQLPMEAQQVVPPTTTTWPRTSFAVSVVPADLTPQRLMAFDQATARDPYKLWGWVQLLPNSVLPAFAKPDFGSEVLAPDDATLVMTPSDAVAQYADVLNAGDGSQFAPTFTVDKLREFVAGNTATQTEALKAAAGSTYTMQFSTTEDPPRAMRTLDGGAIVMARLSSLESFNGPTGAKIGPQTETAKAIFGDAQPSNVLKITYVDVVALYVPAAGSTEQVSLVGFTHVADAVANS